jgi:hypothetical protein
MCRLSRNSDSLNLLEPQRPVQFCNGITLTLQEEEFCAYIKTESKLKFLFLRYLQLGYGTFIVIYQVFYEKNNVRCMFINSRSEEKRVAKKKLSPIKPVIMLKAF